MNFLSVCSGIESASVALDPLGYKAIGLAEVEPFPCSLLTHRFGASRPMFMPDPDAADTEKSKRARRAAIKTVARLPEKGRITNHGDITQFRNWTGVDRFRLLIGGTPCQSFSVAGLRQGLADPRGNLMLTYLAIAAEYRPEWLVWENVPGVLSADDGRAFGTFVKGLEELGYHAAWRVLDAQYVRVDGLERAVPQRRRRVFVVGHLGDWRRAAGVLFDAESLRWNSAPSRKAREGVAGTIGSRAGGGGGLGTDFELGGGLIEDVARCDTTGHGSRYDFETDDFVVSEVAGTINSVGGNSVPGNSVQDAMSGQLIVNSVAASLTQGVESQGKGGYAGRRKDDDVNLVAFDTAQITSSANRSSVTDLSPTMSSGSQLHAASQWRVRRLMPIECERLQGFPDGWTDVPYRGRNVTPDSPRYRAIGNSKAVNVVRWIGARIKMIDELYG